MIKSDRLQRHYGALTVDERFKLLLAALGRGDEKEAISLGRTCPKLTYTMQDRDYTSLVDQARFFMTVLTSNWWRAGFFMMWALSHARQQELDPESDDDGLLDHFFNVWRLAEKHASTITVETDALARMADDLSIPLDDVYTLGPEGFRVEFAPVEGMARHLDESSGRDSFHRQAKTLIADGVEFARLEELRAEHDELARQTRLDDVARVAKQMRAYWNNEQCFD